MRKTQTWMTCTACRTTIPKKDAHPSGYPNSDRGLHIHCSKCDKLVASHVNPKETQ